MDGQFIAPSEIKALGSVPPGSKAVVIHPAVQERMKKDPAYAQEIFAKIDTWFAFDVARNEAIMPGSTWDMSQAVAIREDGNICNACSSSAGGEITYSKSGSDDEESSMMSGGNLQAIFGDEIAGVPTETVLAITQAQVWGGGAIL